MSGPIKITLRREPEANKVSIEVKGPQDEVATWWFDLPWLDEIEWQAVFLSLELQEEDPDTWLHVQGDVRKKAQELGLFLFDENRPSNDRFINIGQALYKAVFGSEEIRQLLDRLLHLESKSPVFEFHIPDEGSSLQAYPWELLHDGKGFLFDSNRASLVRHVDFDERIIQFELMGVLKVLYVAPRPDGDYGRLPTLEKLQLEYLSQDYPDYLTFENLPVSTLSALQKYLLKPENPVHIVHIDTHGNFGWLCKCKWLNKPGMKRCFECHKPQSKDQRNQGYLAFETEDRKIEWVSGEELGKRLYGRGIQVVVLSACRSGVVGGSSTFNSVAGALVKNHIPAVVAMQFSISVQQAEKFAEFFYRALISGMTLTQAVNEARIAFTDSWYRPVLYLRTDASNYQGRIFEPKSPLGLPKKLDPREKWVAKLGFKLDPFRYPDGGRDPFLQNYYYFRMRHFHEVFDVSRPGTIFVFGPSGSGKSGMRNVISQLCRKDDIFPVVYEDFGPLVRKFQKEKHIQVEDHVIQILKTAIRSLAKITKELGRDDASPWKTEESKIFRNQLWLYVSKYEDDPIIQRSLKNYLKPDKKVADAWSDDPREQLGRFCRYVTELFGYQFVYILVDPRDDIDHDEDIARKVLEPLISTHRLLELSDDKVAFKFFLNQKFLEGARNISWIEQEWNSGFYKIKWPDDELGFLLRDRLQLSSDGRYKSLGELSGVDNLDKRVIQLSNESPRELITICGSLFSEHCHKWSPEDGEHLLITDQDVDYVLKPHDEQRHPKSLLEQLIERGENESLEFKSTLRFNRKASRRDEEMDREVARTLCAFMNTWGGTLVIGVDDDGTPLGLDQDFFTLGGRKNKDGFQQSFVNITESLFDPPMSLDNYTAHFEDVRDKLVYVVEVKRSKKPVFCLFDSVYEFYVRKQNTTRKLDAKTQHEYTSEHFKIN